MSDLLAITRAVYRVASSESPRDEARLLALEQIGKVLRAVLRAPRAHPGTSDYFDAWAAAERATRELGALVGDSMLLRPLIEAALRGFSRPGSMG